MALVIAELATTSFRTTQSADAICNKLRRDLGWEQRYVPARLAIARSLSLKSDPPPLTEEEGHDMANPLRGQQLFGDVIDSAAWLALVTQRSGDVDITRKQFQALVTAHWKRGAKLLQDDWKKSDGDMSKFVAGLAELAGFSGEPQQISGNEAANDAPAIAGEVILPVGEIARDSRTDEPVEYSLNAPGGSPHMAIMGGVGSGKTRTAVHMLKELRQQSKVPLLAFDFKGDLSEALGDVFEAEILKPPQSTVPIDVLFVGSSDERDITMASKRIRDAIASVKTPKPSGGQGEVLQAAVAKVLRRGAKGERINLGTVSEALRAEYEDRGRKEDDLISLLRELTILPLFDPVQSPADFFSKNWIIQLPQDSDEETRRLIVNLTLDALDRWINALPDAPTDDQDVRGLRHVTMLDEAHKILSTKLPALGNLIRMSRSKGGAVMLVSQSPDDFESAEDGYLDNMGLTLAFNTQAKPGPTKRIFGDGVSLTGLQTGEAVCRIRSDPRTRKIVAWAV